MTRALRLAEVEQLVLAASERLAEDAEAADVLLGEALNAYGAIPVAAFVHGPSLAAARQLAAACEALTDRLEREKARVSAELVALGDAESAAEAYGTALTSSSFARVG